MTSKYYLIAILIVGAILRFLGMDWGLPYEYQSEEYKVIKYALRMGGGDLNPHSFEYPSLYLYFMLFLYGCYFAFGRIFGLFANAGEFAQLFVKDPSSFYLIGRGCEALFGCGIIILTFWIGRKMFSEKVGLISALMIALIPEFVNKAHFTKGDMSAIFLGTLFWILVYKIAETGEKKYYYFSGIVLGLAISTKYYLAPMGIVLPVAHFLNSNRTSHLPLLISLVMIPIFFVIGTPYSVLGPEFSGDFKAIFFTFGSADTKFWTKFSLKPLLMRVLQMFRNLARMSDFGQVFLFGSYGFGILSYIGILFLFRNWRNVFLLILAPLFVYAVIVASYHNPAAGYLAPVFPLFIVSGAHFVSALLAEKNWKKIAGVVIFSVVAVSSLGESGRIAYSYTLKDTRTIAKEWVEANIPSGSRVLMDLLVNSPPLDMSLKQLTKFYDIAVKTNHYKKEYFKLKLQVHPGPDVGYEIFVLQRQATELGVITYQLTEVQKTQDLVSVKGDGADLKFLKKLGIQYVITNSWAEDNALKFVPRVAAFYNELSTKAKIDKVFEPQTSLHPGPVIKIYRI